MIVITAGKCKIRIRTEGCEDCGTKYASGWEISREVTVTIGKAVRRLEISICDHCARLRASRAKKDGK